MMEGDLEIMLTALIIASRSAPMEMHLLQHPVMSTAVGATAHNLVDIPNLRCWVVCHHVHLP